MFNSNFLACLESVTSSRRIRSLQSEPRLRNLPLSPFYSYSYVLFPFFVQIISFFYFSNVFLPFTLPPSWPPYFPTVGWHFSLTVPTELTRLFLPFHFFRLPIVFLWVKDSFCLHFYRLCPLFVLSSASPPVEAVSFLPLKDTFSTAKVLPCFLDLSTFSALPSSWNYYIINLYL